jgi:hypothetical protein
MLCVSVSSVSAQSILGHSYSSDARNVCYDDRDLKEGILMH